MRGNYQEKSVFHRQYHINVPMGDSVAIIDNPFLNWPDLPDGEDPEETLVFFPAVAIAFENTPAAWTQISLCRVVAGTPQPLDAPLWPDDEQLAVVFTGVGNIAKAILTLWHPLKNADKRFYAVDAEPFRP